MIPVVLRKQSFCMTRIFLQIRFITNTQMTSSLCPLRCRSQCFITKMGRIGGCICECHSGFWTLCLFPCLSYWILELRCTSTSPRVSRTARALLKSYGLVVLDESDVERLTVTIHYKLRDGTARRFGAPIEVISDANDPANIMGLSSLMRLGLQLSPNGVTFENEFLWL